MRFRILVSGHAEVRRCTPTSQTRLFEKAEYMFKKTALNDLSDEELVKTLRQRLRKLCVSPAEALWLLLHAVLELDIFVTFTGSTGSVYASGTLPVKECWRFVR